MGKKSNLTKSTLVALTLALSANVASAQVAVGPTDDNFIRKKDQTSHSEWKEGKSQFPGKPRDMWQVGLGVGSFLISGDVKSQFGWGAGLHVRKSLGYSFSLRLEYLFAQASGLNYQASSYRAYPNVSPFTITSATGTVVAPGSYNAPDHFYSNYKITQFHAVSLQTIYNLNNIKFHRKSNKWSLNLIAGLGANLYQTRINALDQNGNTYATQMNALVNNADFDVRNLNDRNAVRSELKTFLDDDYETLPQQNAKNFLTVGKDDERKVVNPFINVGLSVEYLVSSRLSIGLEHQGFISDDDFIDGKSRKENGARTSNIDIPHYTSIRLGFHIGSKKKAVQPLWFLNPLVYPMKDVADLKEKLDDDWFKDTDKDGVPDALDQEPDTPADTEVDSKGRTLDSDGDGVPNSTDKEPFSPPGYATNPEGIAQIPTPITKEDVKIDNSDPERPKLIIGEEVYDPIGTSGGGTLKDWYLPMVHFDLDKYYLRPEAYEQLLHVASVMKGYPKLKIIAHGHTDVRSSDEYNDMLSYNRSMTAIDFLVNKYGIDRSRFVIRYNGEGANLIEGANKEPEHFMNRRVEFYIAEDNATSQPRPSTDGGASRKWKY